MFEEMTYENLLKSTLARVPNDIDKRQGSIIYDAIAPACAELAQAYIRLSMILDNSFADTAIREYLVLRAKEIGIEPYTATNAVVKGEFDKEVSVGSRFYLAPFYYRVTENIEDYIYKLECETPGAEANNYLGNLLPVSTSGLKMAKITEILIPGRDEENTEDFRERYFDTINNRAFGGNKADYRRWVSELDGVGQVKVARTPSGGGTVDVIVLDTSNEPASAELTASIENYLDPTNGFGDGIAPVGHMVTVTPAGTRTINITVDWELAEGVDSSAAISTAETIIGDYLNELNSGWDKNEYLKIYSAQVLVRLLEIQGVTNIADVKINNLDYVTAASNQIFKLGIIKEV